MDLGTLVATIQIKDQDFERVLRQAAQNAQRTERTLQQSLGGVEMDADASGFEQAMKDAPKAAKDSSRQITSALSQISSTLDKQTGAVTESTRAWAANKIGADQLRAMEQMGVSTREYVDAVVGAPGALDRMRSALAGNGDALERLDQLTRQVSQAQADFQARARAIGSNIGSGIAGGIERGVQDADVDGALRRATDDVDGSAAGAGIGGDISSGMLETFGGSDFGGILGDMVERSRSAGEESGGKMSGFIMGGMAGLGMAAAKVFWEAWDQYSATVAVTGLNKAALGLDMSTAKESGQAAADLYGKGWGEGIEETGAAVRAVMTQTGITGRDEVQKYARQAMAISATTGEEVDRIARGAAQLFRNGLVGSYQEGFDLIAKASQGSVDAAHDMIDTIEEYSPIFAQLGVDGPTAMGLINQAILAGARNGDVAADAVKEYYLKIQSGAPEVRQAFSDIGLDFDAMKDTILRGGPDAVSATAVVWQELAKVEDPAKRSADAVAIFGTKGEDMARTVNSMDLSAARQQFTDTSGTADQMATDIEQSGNRIDLAWRGVTSAAAVYFEQMGSQADVTAGKLAESALAGESWLSQIGLSAQAAAQSFGINIQGMLDKIGELRDSFNEAMTEIFGAIEDKVQGLPEAQQSALIAAVSGQVFADGGRVGRDGRISGPGGPRDDLVVGFDDRGNPLRVSDEEQIMNGPAVRRWGAVLDAMNAGRFADGGRVGGAARSAAGVGSAPDPWQAIAGTVTDAWEQKIRPALDAFTAASQGVGEEQTSLQDVVVPSWEAVAKAVQDAQQDIIQPTYDTLNRQTRDVGSEQQALQGVVASAWQDIQDVHAGSLAAITDQAYTPMSKWMARLGVEQQALTGTTDTAWKTIQGSHTSVYAALDGSVYSPMSTWLGTLGAAQQTLSSATDIAWGSIGSKIKSTYDAQIVPAWTGVQDFASGTGSFFDGINSGVGNATDKIIGDLKEITSAIDEFFGMVDTRSGGGGGASGSLSVNAPGFARGGILPGVDTGKDDQIIAARSGEAVMVPQFARAVGGPAGVDRLNRMAEAGQLQGFARGGVVGDKISHPLESIVTEGAQKAIEAGIDKLFSSVGGYVSNGNWGPATDGSSLAANTQAARDFIVKTWGITNIGGVYGGSVPGSDHPIGKALDVMIANYLSAAGIAQGTSVADWFVGHPNAFGTKYVIWRDRINQGGSWAPYQHPSGSNDTLQHRDHVHLSFLTGGGQFNGQPVGDTADGGSWLDRQKARIKAGAPSATPAPVEGGAFPPMVERWRPLGLDVLGQVGNYKALTLVQHIDRMLNQIASESAGDPDAINNYDINAQRGDPSIGLLQVIGSTFRNALSGTPFEYLIPRGQRDPRASMTSSTLYSLNRYGSLEKAWRGVAYKDGGMVPGPRSWGVDSVPGMLTPGEGVLTEPQVDAYQRVGEHLASSGTGLGAPIDYTKLGQAVAGALPTTNLSPASIRQALSGLRMEMTDNGGISFTVQMQNVVRTAFRDRERAMRRW